MSTVLLIISSQKWNNSLTEVVSRSTCYISAFAQSKRENKLQNVKVLIFSSEMKNMAVPFLPANFDLLVMWNLSQVKYLPGDAVEESKEPGDDERQLSAGHSVCSILMGSLDTHKSIMEEAPKRMSAKWTKPERQCFKIYFKRIWRQN